MPGTANATYQVPQRLLGLKQVELVQFSCLLVARLVLALVGELVVELDNEGLHGPEHQAVVGHQPAVLCGQETGLGVASKARLLDQARGHQLAQVLLAKVDQVVVDDGVDASGIRTVHADRVIAWVLLEPDVQKRGLEPLDGRLEIADGAQDDLCVDVLDHVVVQAERWNH